MHFKKSILVLDSRYKGCSIVTTDIPTVSWRIKQMTFPWMASVLLPLVLRHCMLLFRSIHLDGLHLDVQYGQT